MDGEGSPPPAPPEPPVLEDRRRLPDRRQRDRAPQSDGASFVRTAVAAGVAVCGGLVIVYVFFAAIGAFDFATAAVATAVVVVLGGVWLVAYWYRQRTAEPRSPATFDRERRGF